VKRRPLLYIETSVFGFCFDPEPRNAVRREAATRMFEQIRLGLLEAATSPLTFTELDRTAEPRRSELLSLLSLVRRVSADKDEVGRLATVYLQEHVVPERFAEDAEHVAYATVCKADVLVSLNLRHLANEWAERRVCAVNLREGYQPLSIRTPEEVLEYED
jgi:predicted nucleic acid-binding protein